MSTVTDGLVGEVNRARASRGLPPLAIEPHLTAAAIMHAGNMARLNILSHTLPVWGEITMTQRLRKVEYAPYRAAAENIAWNYSTGTVIAGWVQSPGHAVNLFGDYTETGLAFALNRRGEPYYAMVFGRRS